MRPTLLLLTLLLNSISGFSQTRCDTTRKDIWTILEHPPQPTITDAELESKLNSITDPIALKKYNAEYLYVSFFVNCKGEDFNYKLAKLSEGVKKFDTTSKFQKTFLSDFQSFASWTPGRFTFYEKGRPVEKTVDFQGNYTIRIKDNKLYILNKKEKKKHFK